MLCGVVAACHRYGVCTVAHNTAHNTHTIPMTCASTHTIPMTCCQYTHHIYDMLPVHTPYL